MVVDLAAQYAELDQASGLVRDIGDELTKRTQAVQQQVDSLTTAGWRGSACDAYRSAWADWVDAADRVLEALAGESRLIGEFRSALQTTDGGVTDAMTAIHSRLGGSSGGAS